MKISFQTGRSVAFVALALLSASAYAAQHPGYWYEGHYNTIVRDSSGDCVRSILWTEATAIPECTAGYAKKEAPQAAVKPAPVVKAAPVVSPAPVAAPTLESRKAAMIETPVRLEGANFATGSSKLLNAAGSKLDEVVNAANQFPDIHLAVTGYTDNTGDAQKNVTLSQDRANAVKAYLVSKGIAADRISSTGHGADSPIADNATSEGRAKNRRVEVRYTIKEEMKD
jgi:OOP family OmpA-OmpF porin